MATYYAVAAGGSWTASSTWASSSGGTGGAGVPTAADDVILDGNSGSVTVQGSCLCRSVDCNNGDAAGPYAATLTINSASYLTPGHTDAPASGLALRLSAGMTVTIGSTTSGGVVFVSSAASQLSITTAGQTLGQVQLDGTGSWIIEDELNTYSASPVNLTEGTLNTNNTTCSWGGLSSSGTLTRKLTLGSSTITLLPSVQAWYTNTTTNLTITANTATLNFPNLNTSANGIEAGNLNFNGASLNVTLGATAVGSIGSTVTMANLTITGAAGKVGIFYMPSSSCTITGTLTINANSAINRLLICSGTTGTACTVSAATVACTGAVDFQDIAAAGSATWTTGASGATYFGDCGGNTGIAMTAAQTIYGVNTTGNCNWSTANWATSTGGSSGARVPLPQDSVVLDGNSGTVNYAIDVPRLGGTLTTTTAFVGTLYIGVSTAMYGSLTAGASVTWSGTSFVYLSSRTTCTISCATPVAHLVLNGPGSTYTLGQSITLTQWLAVNYGTINDGGYNVTTPLVTSNVSTTRAFVITSTWTLTGTASVWNLSTTTGLTLTAAGSTIVISDTSAASKTFAGGAGITYGNLTITGGGAGAVIFVNTNTFNVFTVGAPKTVTLSSAVTTTASQWYFNGLSGNPITVNASTAGSAASISQSSGSVLATYTSFQDNTAKGGASFAYDQNSSAVSNVAGWGVQNTPIVQSAIGTVTTGTSITATLQNAPTPGNTLIAVFGGYVGGTGASLVTPPSGFTTLQSNAQKNSAGSNPVQVGTAYRTVQTGDEKSWTFTTPSNSGTATSGAFLFEIAGSITPTATVASGAAGGSAPVCTASTSTNPGDLCLGVGAIFSAYSDQIMAQGTGASSGWNSLEQFPVSSTAYGALSVFSLTSPGGTITTALKGTAVNTANENWVGVLLQVPGAQGSGTASFTFQGSATGKAFIAGQPTTSGMTQAVGAGVATSPTSRLGSPSNKQTGVARVLGPNWP